MTRLDAHRFSQQTFSLYSAPARHLHKSKAVRRIRALIVWI